MIGGQSEFVRSHKQERSDEKIVMAHQGRVRPVYAQEGPGTGCARECSRGETQGVPDGEATVILYKHSKLNLQARRLRSWWETDTIYLATKWHTPGNDINGERDESNSQGGRGGRGSRVSEKDVGGGRRVEITPGLKDSVRNLVLCR